MCPARKLITIGCAQQEVRTYIRKALDGGHGTVDRAGRAVPVPDSVVNLRQERQSTIAHALEEKEHTRKGFIAKYASTVSTVKDELGNDDLQRRFPHPYIHECSMSDYASTKTG